MIGNYPLLSRKLLAKNLRVSWRPPSSGRTIRSTSTLDHKKRVSMKHGWPIPSTFPWSLMWVFLYKNRFSGTLLSSSSLLLFHGLLEGHLFSQWHAVWLVNWVEKFRILLLHYYSQNRNFKAWELKNALQIKRKNQSDFRKKSNWLSWVNERAINSCLTKSRTWRCECITRKVVGSKFHESCRCDQVKETLYAVLILKFRKVCSFVLIITTHMIHLSLPVITTFFRFLLGMINGRN